LPVVLFAENAEPILAVDEELAGLEEGILEDLVVDLLGNLGFLGLSDSLDLFVLLAIH